MEHNLFFIFFYDFLWVRSSLNHHDINHSTSLPHNFWSLCRSEPQLRRVISRQPGDFSEIRICVAFCVANLQISGLLHSCAPCTNALLLGMRSDQRHHSLDFCLSFIYWRGEGIRRNVDPLASLVAGFRILWLLATERLAQRGKLGVMECWWQRSGKLIPCVIWKGDPRWEMASLRFHVYNNNV